MTILVGPDNDQYTVRLDLVIILSKNRSTVFECLIQLIEKGPRAKKSSVSVVLRLKIDFEEVWPNTKMQTSYDFTLFLEANKDVFKSNFQ